MDKRWDALASILVNYSIGVKPGDRVLITMMETETEPLARACYREAVRAGGYPFIEYQSAYLEKDLMLHGTMDQVEWVNEMCLKGMDWADCYIGLRGARNPYEWGGIPGARLSAHKRSLGRVSAERNRTRWVLTRVPNEAFAQQSRMPLEDMMDFYFNSTLVDWEKESAALQKVKELLAAGSSVRVTGKETDITFTTSGRIYAVADGHINMPDGEVYTCPVETSVNGTIYFEFPGAYAGNYIEGIRLTFQDGKLVRSSAETNEGLLREILATDEGASTLGEFGIGLNYGITGYCGDILYDEKIGGTIHFAMGRGYPECLGNDRSALHWDIIKDTRKEGAVYLDGKRRGQSEGEAGFLCSGTCYNRDRVTGDGAHPVGESHSPHQ